MRDRSIPLILFTLVLTFTFPLFAGDRSPHTDWFQKAGYGVFIHFLPDDEASFAKVKDFDVGYLADQLESVGAGYLILTLGQNSGYFNPPNSSYDAATGYRPGERCSTRDLPMELFEALRSKGIRLMLYLPSQTPNEDGRAQAAFGFPVGKKDQPIAIESARKWARVIREWSVRYGDKLSGWWFDGGYDHVGFNEEIAGIYAEAARAGNPSSIITFNPGIKLVRHTQAEDYTAGELQEPFDFIPTSRWLDGSQWQALTYLGSHWSARDVRYPAERWAEWAKKVVSGGGVISFDSGPSWDSSQGPIGSLAEPQMEILGEISTALKNR
ncbi:MAG: alpha-L-fucosidase [Acidobacteriota bacterium]|nr:MAG: alpha-L-fucosidase [Acidobacteriota bacterium]